MFLDISLSNNFFTLVSSGKYNKSKSKQTGLYLTKKLCIVKETEPKKKKKKATS